MAYNVMSGKVYFKDWTGPGIPNATINWKDLGSPIDNAFPEAVTDGTGHYSCQVPVNADLSITADHVTCLPQTKTHHTNGDFVVNFALQPDV